MESQEQLFSSSEIQVRPKKKNRFYFSSLRQLEEIVFSRSFDEWNAADAVRYFYYKKLQAGYAFSRPQPQTENVVGKELLGMMTPKQFTDLIDTLFDRRFELVDKNYVFTTIRVLRPSRRGNYLLKKCLRLAGIDIDAKGKQQTVVNETSRADEIKKLMEKK